MNEFNPGPGWREAAPTEVGPYDEYIRHNTRDTVQVWVREAPLPPLPTVPYTVIRVDWKDGSTPEGTVLMLHPIEDEMRWGPYTVNNVQRLITGFVVLSEPRAVTAKAVGEAIRAVARPDAGYYDHQFTAEQLRDVLSDFGVES